GAVGIKRPILRSPTGIVALIASAIIALILSGGAGTEWQVLSLFQHASPTGVTDPVLGQYISFYLLSLPFLHSIVNWALGLGFMGTLLVAVLYAWRGDSFDLNFSQIAIAHLSATLAVFAVAVAGWRWLGRLGVLYVHNCRVVWVRASASVRA